VGTTASSSITVAETTNINPLLGRVKQRTIAMTPMVAHALKGVEAAMPAEGQDREGRRCARAGLSQRQGQSRVSCQHRQPRFYPLLVACGISEDNDKKDEEGKPIMRAKYGMHTLRHFFASWITEQGFSPKKVQGMLGHNSMQMTYDVYGHLFPSLEDDHAKMAAGELALVKWVVQLPELFGTSRAWDFYSHGRLTTPMDV
jgi:integrase